MIIKKILFSILLLAFFAGTSFAAGSSDSGSKKTLYDKAVEQIKIAKKLEKKGKTEKAIKRYERAIKFLVKSNKKKPNKADTLNYLGFATRKIGDFENGEKYYLQGLAIEPSIKVLTNILVSCMLQQIELILQKKDWAFLRNVIVKNIIS